MLGRESPDDEPLDLLDQGGPALGLGGKAIYTEAPPGDAEKERCIQLYTEATVQNGKLKIFLIG